MDVHPRFFSAILAEPGSPYWPERSIVPYAVVETEIYRGRRIWFERRSDRYALPRSLLVNKLLVILPAGWLDRK
jgi:hypothetical protein